MYLGGGVPWDPPFAYGLVFRELPFHVAERLAAVILFLAQGVVGPDMIAMKPAADPSRKCSQQEKDESFGVNESSTLRAICLHCETVLLRGKNCWGIVE